MFESSRKSALLVDFDNIIQPYGRPLLDNIDRWVAWLERGEFDPARARRRFVKKCVFWNTENDTHRQVFRRSGFDVHVCRAIRKEKASSADFDITIQAMEWRHTDRSIQEFVILSFDTDFSSVLLHLNMQKRTSVAMIDEGQLEGRTETPTLKFRRIVDFGIGKAEFRSALNYEPGKSGQKAPKNLEKAPPKQAPVTDTTTAPEFNYTNAAATVARAASSKGLTQIGKDKLRLLIQHMPGFFTSARQMWAGSYSKMLDEIVRCEPNKFHLEKTPNGGAVLTYRGNKSGHKA